MKQSEIIKLSTAELQEKLSETRRTYAELRSAHAISPIQNPLQIRFVRRAVARLATELSKRELQ
ncbi:50S ribosomal protein L29 [Flavobacterium croceum]|jgi:large subunit ribosomal protein L29|uniref:Large ribosomal subunit protein uL29 n=1 Tax=Flavobacterium croceum DSM 17960 TaxID=1121886 RepID=A0A2S4N9M1_9FLAO|nr:50S ribosomal protein L29 [Flavobacterium croceum]POS02401.1 LSU ribosomal protein L29P [Flavobacterium croceum DSM 17960]